VGAAIHLIQKVLFSSLGKGRMGASWDYEYVCRSAGRLFCLPRCPQKEWPILDSGGGSRRKSQKKKKVKADLS
jgi:hypothetical protein